MSSAPANRAQALKDEYVRVRGHWIEEFEGLATYAPDFLEAHLAAGAVVARSELISPELSELIAIAIDVSTTHLYERGLRLHMQKALALGAPPARIAAVILIVSGLGVQTLLVGLPLLAEVSGGTAADIAGRMRPLTVHEERLKAEYLRLAHVWSNAHQLLLVLSPDYFEAQLGVVRAALGTDALTDKEKALIVLAVNGAVTHLREPGLRHALQGAIAAGAGADEIIHVLRRVSPLGIHSVMFGMPILLEEAARFERDAH